MLPTCFSWALAMLTAHAFRKRGALHPTDQLVAMAMGEMYVCLSTGEMGREESDISSGH